MHLFQRYDKLSDWKMKVGNCLILLLPVLRHQFMFSSCEKKNNNQLFNLLRIARTVPIIITRQPAQRMLIQGNIMACITMNSR
jgi:hypothetical protein